MRKLLIIFMVGVCTACAPIPLVDESMMFFVVDFSNWF